MFWYVQKLQQNYSINGQSALLNEINVHSKYWLCNQKDESIELVWISQVSQNHEKIKGLMALIHKKRSLILG